MFFYLSFICKIKIYRVHKQSAWDAYDTKSKTKALASAKAFVLLF